MSHSSTEFSARSRVRLRGPEEIVAAVPHLLGFHPRESVVVLGLSAQSGRICLSLRVDLPAPEHGGDLAGLLIAHLRGAGAASAIVLVFTDLPAEGGRLPRHALAAVLRSSLTRARIGLRDLICVHRQRWWSYGCRRPGCCPAEGRPVRPDAASVLAAATVAAGRVVHPDREALVGILAPAAVDGEPGDEAARRERFAAAAERYRAALASPAGQRGAIAAIEAVVVAWADRPGALDDEEAVRFCVALATIEVRDGCLRWLDGPRADAAEGLWLALVRIAVPPYAAAPATLLGLHAYARGDGAFARICTERALADEPGYAMATLVYEALDHALPPAAIRQLAACLEPADGDG